LDGLLHKTIHRRFVGLATKPTRSQGDRGGQVKEQGKIELAVRAAEAKDYGLKLGVEVAHSSRGLVV
jgi:hypothetical protein